MGSIAVGVGVSVLCYAAVTFLKPMFGYDDSLDVFGVHGIGGTWGALATGLFIADFALPEGVTKGAQIVTQLKSILFTAAFAPIATLVILLVLRAVFGSLRLDEEAEFDGRRSRRAQRERLRVRHGERLADLASRCSTRRARPPAP